MSLTVTVVDNETGETATKQVADDDYFIVAVGRCYVSHVNAFATGTHIVTVKGCAHGV